MRRGKKRAIHTFGEVASISKSGNLSRIEIDKMYGGGKLLTIYSEKIPKRGLIWVVIAPFRRELLGRGERKPFMIAKLMEMVIKERQIIASFKSVEGDSKVEIILDDRGRARNLKAGEDYIFDLIDRQEFFEAYERGSIPAGMGGKRSEPERLGAERMRIFMEMASIKVGQRVLDTAAGEKEYLKHFSEKGCRIVCTNISKTILKRTQRLIGGDKHSFVVCDLERGFPFRNGGFDLVICDALLEYLSGPHDILNQIFDLIKCGGILLLLEPTRSVSKIPDFYPQDLWEVALWRPIYDLYFNESCLEKTLLDKGFKIAEKRTMKFTYPIYDEEQFSQSIICLYKGSVS